jgi:hypothetical protein
MRALLIVLHSNLQIASSCRSCLPFPLIIKCFLSNNKSDFILISSHIPQSLYSSFMIQGVQPTHPPTHEHLGIKGVPRNSAGVETFFAPHALHLLHEISAVSRFSCKRRLPRWLFQYPLKYSWPLKEVNPGPWIDILPEVTWCNRRDRNQRVPDRVSMGDGGWRTLLITFCCMNCSVTVAVWGRGLSARTYSFRLVLPTWVLRRSDSRPRIWVT